MSDSKTIDLRVDESEPYLVAVPVRLRETGEGAVLKRGRMTLEISGEYSLEAVRLVLALSGDGGATREQILQKVPATAREPVAELVDELTLRRVLVPQDETTVGPEDPLDVYYWHFGARAEEVITRVGEAGVTLLGVNAISRRIRAALAASGIHATEVVDQPSLRNPEPTDRDLAAIDWDGTERVVPYEEWLERMDDPEEQNPVVVATSETGAQQLLRSLNEFCVRRDVQLFPVILQDLLGYAGPLVVPGRTACFECLRARQNSCMDAPELHRAAEGGSAAVGYHPSMAAVLADLAALEITKFLGGVPAPQYGRLIEVNLLAPSVGTRTVLKVPRCPVCGAMENRSPISTKQLAFQPPPQRDADA